MLLRNFIYTLRTQKTASALNILGLTITLAAFYVIAGFSSLSTVFQSHFGCSQPYSPLSLR